MQRGNVKNKLKSTGKAISRNYVFSKGRLQLSTSVLVACIPNEILHSAALGKQQEQCGVVQVEACSRGPHANLLPNRPCCLGLCPRGSCFLAYARVISMRNGRVHIHFLSAVSLSPCSLEKLIVHVSCQREC